MPKRLLNKGLEIELYAGRENGEVLPLSTLLSKNFFYISQEPDQRNFEFITDPTTQYNEIFKQVIERRNSIRNFLKKQGNLTLIPGSTIFLPFSKEFYYSKKNDPYHEFILKTYKTKVITTSIHINIGIDDYNDLFKLLSALRLDVSIFLALSASSPFYDGKTTDFASYRWHSFPKTPKLVPFFKNHDEYINWTNKNLSSKKMLNVRHLWTSIRPNGSDRPYDLNRIELRICDLVIDPLKLLGIVSLLECIVQKYLKEKSYPKILNNKSLELNYLVKQLLEEEENVAKYGLNATIWDWRNDCTNKATKVIENLYKEHESLAKELGIIQYLKKVLEILTEGNESNNFIQFYKKNKSISETIKYFTQNFTIMDLKYAQKIKSKQLIS